MNKGYILLARQIQDSEIWKKPSDWFKVWIYILQEVSHSDNKISERGEKLFNAKDISRFTNVKYGKIDNILRWLKSTEQITTRKTTRGMFIKVLNYEVYQDSQTYKNGTDNETKSKKLTKQKRNRNETINNNGNNVIINISFEQFWEAYAKKNDRKKAEAKWNRLKDDQKEKAMNAAAAYVKSTPEVKYRKNPLTWLNGECWEDEVDDIEIDTKEEEKKEYFKLGMGRYSIKYGDEKTSEMISKYGIHN